MDNANVVNIEENSHIRDKTDSKEYAAIPTCCSHSSLAFLRFAAQYLILFIALIFSFVMLMIHPEQNNAIYYSIITLSIGVAIPNPRVHK